MTRPTVAHPNVAAAVSLSPSEKTLRIVFVVALLLGLIGLIYRALRPYLKVARQFIRTVRHFQKVSVPRTGSPRDGEKLVQCATCGTWIPQSRSLMAEAREYCSRDCLKRAARGRKVAG